MQKMHVIGSWTYFIVSLPKSGVSSLVLRYNHARLSGVKIKVQTRPW